MKTSKLWITWAVLGAATIILFLDRATSGLIITSVLLGPLVAFPLGMHLISLRVPRALGPMLDGLAWAWPLPAAASVIAFTVPEGNPVGFAGLGWSAYGVATAVLGVRWLIHRHSTVADWATAVALGQVVVGAVSLGLWRSGTWTDLLAALTAAHFHFVGFVTPLLAAELLTRLEGGPWFKTARVASVVLIVAVPITATGIQFQLVPVEHVGALLVVAAVVLIALLLPRVPGSHRARGLLVLSAISGIVAMAFSAYFVIAPYFGGFGLGFVIMLQWHAPLNAIGFSVLGLVGLIVASGPAGAPRPIRPRRRITAEAIS